MRWIVRWCFSIQSETPRGVFKVILRWTAVAESVFEAVLYNVISGESLHVNECFIKGKRVFVTTSDRPRTSRRFFLFGWVDSYRESLMFYSGVKVFLYVADRTFSSENSVLWLSCKHWDGWIHRVDERAETPPRIFTKTPDPESTASNAKSETEILVVSYDVLLICWI